MMTMMIRNNNYDDDLISCAWREAICSRENLSLLWTGKHTLDGRGWEHGMELGDIHFQGNGVYKKARLAFVCDNSLVWNGQGTVYTCVLGN